MAPRSLSLLFVAWVLASAPACSDGASADLRGGPAAQGSSGDAGAPEATGPSAGDAAGVEDPADAGAWHDAASVSHDAAPAGDAASASDSSVGGGCAAAFLCDDFEQDAPGQAPGAPFAVETPNCSGAGTAAVDSSQAHSGTRSVRVAGAGGYCDHVFFGAALPSAATGTMWGRFYVRFDAALGAGHVTFLAMHDASVGKDLRMGGQDQVLMWNRESDDATLPAMSPAGTAQSLAPAIARWTCVEFAVDQTAHTLRTWVDGAPVAGLVDDGVPTPDVDAQWLQGTAWAPRLADVRFGWESYAGQADTLWFDDVAVGDARLGCGP
jgi:hypothetical protein